ncbi:MAG: VWA domain-containing protein, partial [Candidatus Omnitrophica bacterium]|nr:VWA domain-containing protein [Candidatus Omnitrophota bacterium]
KDFVIANYAKDLSGGSVPSKYQYVDESQPPGSFDPVALEISQNISGMDQIGPMLADVQKWGAVYHEVRPDSTVPYIQVDYSVDNGAPAFFCLLAIKAGEIEMEIRHEGLDFEESFANNNYDTITVVVAGLEQDVNYRYSINGTQPIINILDPLAGRKALVGDKDAPEKFVAKVEVLDPDSNPIEGIADSEFTFEIGPQTLGAGNIVTSAYVQGQYWFVIQSPTQTANTDYDFVASWSVLSDTETNAVSYMLRADADNMLVIDKSGSMGAPISKLQDAQDAANLYVDSWREGDKVGVASFNCTADPSDLTLRNWDSMSREDAHMAIGGITAGGNTSIGAGLQEGLDELVARGDSSHQWAVILLSDGNNTCDPDIADFLSTYEARKDNGDQVPQVHAVAIGADANRPDLENLATKTGGTYQFAAEPSPKGPAGTDFARDIAEIYRVVSEKVSRQQQIFVVRDELRRDPVNSHIFTVDGGASELVVVTKFQPLATEPIVTLTDPEGGTHPATNSIVNRHKVFRIGSPIPGQWKIELQCAQGSEFCFGAEYLVEAAVKSSLTMDMFFVLPVEERIVGTPMPVLVSLTDTGPIKGAIVGLGIEDPLGASSGILLFDDGLHGDGEAGDGIYGNTIFNTSAQGTYRVQSVAIGNSDDFGPFQRRVLESFVMRGDSDNDKDRIPDSYERRVGLDPKNPDDAGEDPDEDDLNNYL